MQELPGQREGTKKYFHDGYFYHVDPRSADIGNAFICSYRYRQWQCPVTAQKNYNGEINVKGEHGHFPTSLQTYQRFEEFKRKLKEQALESTDPPNTIVNKLKIEYSDVADLILQSSAKMHVIRERKRRQGKSQGGSKQRAEKAATTGQIQKRHRGGRGKNGRSTPGSRDKPPKRSRPDDTQTPPTKEAIRIKASTLDCLMKDALTYADSVVLSDLFVAVTTEPFTDLTAEQVEDIKGTLETSIVEITDAPCASNAVPYWPSFRGKPFHSDGVLKLQCEDKKDVEWLKYTIATFVSPIPGTRLVVKRQKDIPSRVKSAVLLPHCTDDIKTIQTVLIGQNKWYQVSRWSFYNVEHHEGETPGTFLVLGIPVDQVPGILARGRRLCYKLGNAYIRFFGSTGKLQDMPPALAETATAPTISGAPDSDSDI